MARWTGERGARSLEFGLFLVGCGAFVCLGTWGLSTDLRMMRAGRRTSGRVVARTIQGVSRRCVYAYTVAGVGYRVESTCPSANGERLEIEYLPDAPTVARVPKNTGLVVEMRTVCFAIGSVGFGAALR